MNKIILVLVLCSSLISCVNNEPAKKTPVVADACPVDERPTPKELNELLKKALNKGDKMAYNEFATHYLLNGSFTDLYYHSLLMANKYHNAEAYYHLYTMLTYHSKTIINGVNLYNSDFETTNMALYYLIKSYELGSEEAISDIKITFKDTTSIPKSSYYLKKMARGK